MSTGPHLQEKTRIMQELDSSRSVFKFLHKSKREKQMHQLWLRIALTWICIWHVQGSPIHHFVPHDAKLAPKNEWGQRDEKEPKYK